MKKIIIFILILLTSCSSIKKKKYDDNTIRIFRGEKCVHTIAYDKFAFTLLMSRKMISILECEVSGRLRVLQDSHRSNVLYVVWYDENFKEIHRIFIEFANEGDSMSPEKLFD